MQAGFDTDSPDSRSWTPIGETSNQLIVYHASVFLATHVIGGNVLGQYAVKKIAVGTSKEYLVRILREVRLLEALRHPNIIPYYHSWVDETQFSAFGPPILALHVLMMYATAGNLDSFLLNRSYGDPSQPPQSAADVGDAENIDLLPKAERIKAFKRRRQSGNHGRRGETRGVLLLGLDEILKLFGDVVSGLAFLHSNSILHLDLKCSNVLLHWEEGEVIPKALLSDFGTSEEMLRGSRERSGHTGTMEYMAPETIVTDTRGNWRPSDSHADMWSLGMVLHKLLFLRLPYEFTEDLQRLHVEIVAYPGFEATPSLVETCERRHIPRNVLLLLEKLLHLSPDQRPSAERVRLAIDALRTGSMRRNASRPWRKKATGTGANATDSYRNYQKRSPESSSPIRSLLALPPPSEPVIGTQLLEPTVDMVPQSAVYSFQLARSVVFVLKVLSRPFTRKRVTDSLNHCKSASPLRFTLNHGV
ncbi:hypothetical protein CcaverHIS002_0308060 [Cutaneotrichosporon cavernicola]|nr:hypothetical protein CcaverHIS002_0308060 [Cutaneotrichosporon cavernicola]